jgi:crossover junction endodeoxyribonuclease RusA
LTGDVAIAILAAPPDKRKRDLDNVLKALLDSLTHCGVWTDDSQVAELVIRRVEPCKPGHVMIMVDSLGDEYE